MGDPLRELEVGRRVAGHDDELGVVGGLVDAEGDGDRHHGGNGPPGRRDRPRARAGSRPGARAANPGRRHRGQPAQAEHHQRDGHRHGQQHGQTGVKTPGSSSGRPTRSQAMTSSAGSTDSRPSSPPGGVRRIVAPAPPVCRGAPNGPVVSASAPTLIRCCPRKTRPRRGLCSTMYPPRSEHDLVACFARAARRAACSAAATERELLRAGCWRRPRAHPSGVPPSPSHSRTVSRPDSCGPRCSPPRR